MIETDTLWRLGVVLSGSGLVSTAVLHVAALTTPPARRRPSAPAARLLAERDRAGDLDLTGWLRGLTRVTPGELPDELPPLPTDPGEH